MKKVLVLLMLSMTMSATTGCAGKKRVKALEEELTRCRQKKAQLKATNEMPANHEYAVQTASD